MVLEGEGALAARAQAPAVCRVIRDEVDPLRPALRVDVREQVAPLVADRRAVDRVAVALAGDVAPGLVCNQRGGGPAGDADEVAGRARLAAVRQAHRAAVVAVELAPRVGV